MNYSTDPTTATAAASPPCPPWCDPEFCRVTVPGERLHSERPRRFIDDAVQVDVGLIAPEDRADGSDRLCTYIDLHVNWPELENCEADVWLTLLGAQELYDQLGARLYAARRAAGRRCVMTRRAPVPVPATSPMSVVLTCGSNACRHTFEPDPAVFTTAQLACPSCGGWTLRAELVEPAAAGGAS